MTLYYCLPFVYLLVTSHGEIVNEDCPFVFNVERSVKNDGFHRAIDYYFELLSNGDLSDCKVCFKQSVPNGLYVNKDQVTELVRLRKLSAIVEGSVDVEAPADNSSPHNVHLFVELDSAFNTLNATVSLPIHTRYHPSRKGGGFEEAILSPPKVFLSCAAIPEQCLSTTGSPVQKISLKSCPAVSDQNEYVSVKYEIRDKPAEILIPVGNSSHYEIVQLFTFVVTWVGSKFIYYTLLNHKPKDSL